MKGCIISTTDPVRTPKHGTVTDSRIMSSQFAAKQARINSGVAYLEMDLKIKEEKARKHPSQSYIANCERIKKDMEHFYLENKEAVVAAFSAKYGVYTK